MDRKIIDAERIYVTDAIDIVSDVKISDIRIEENTIIIKLKTGKEIRIRLIKNPVYTINIHEFLSEFITFNNLPNTFLQSSKNEILKFFKGLCVILIIKMYDFNLSEIASMLGLGNHSMSIFYRDYAYKKIKNSSYKKIYDKNVEHFCKYFIKN